MQRQVSKKEYTMQWTQRKLQRKVLHYEKNISELKNELKEMSRLRKELEKANINTLENIKRKYSKENYHADMDWIKDALET